MLGFFFRHYDEWVDRYVIVDDGSTDGTLDLLHAHPKVEVRSFERTPDSFVHAQTELNNHAWKDEPRHRRLGGPRRHRRAPAPPARRDGRLSRATAGRRRDPRPSARLRHGARRSADRRRAARRRRPPRPAPGAVQQARHLRPGRGRRVRHRARTARGLARGRPAPPGPRRGDALPLQAPRLRPLGGPGRAAGQPPRHAGRGGQAGHPLRHDARGAARLLGGPGGGVAGARRTRLRAARDRPRTVLVGRPAAGQDAGA